MGITGANLTQINNIIKRNSTLTHPYKLPNIKKFLNWFKKLNKKTYLIHSLSIYSKNKQKYGKKYFCDTKSMLKFFNLEYLNITSVKHSIRGDGKQIFFLAHNR